MQPLPNCRQIPFNRNGLIGSEAAPHGKIWRNGSMIFPTGNPAWYQFKHFDNHRSTNKKYQVFLQNSSGHLRGHLLKHLEPPFLQKNPQLGPRKGPRRVMINTDKIFMIKREPMKSHHSVSVFQRVFYGGFQPTNFRGSSSAWETTNQ